MPSIAKLIFVIAVTFGIIYGCDNASSTKELMTTRDDESFKVNLHLVHDKDQLADTCAKLGTFGDVNGCNAFNLDTKTCDIYVMPQRFQQDVERLTVIGHEVWHCRFGRWH